MVAESSGTGRFLPFRTYPQWLEPGTADALLAYAIENEAHFKPAAVAYDGNAGIDPAFRDAARLKALGSFEALLSRRALEAKPDLERAFGIKPFDVKQVETELVAYGDNAHFNRHIDTGVAGNRAPTVRVLTLVLYFHRRPMRFTGGALRFHALGGSGVLDVAPDHNVLAAFPSIARHSVERVVCPGGGFADSRFAAVMWIHG